MATIPCRDCASGTVHTGEPTGAEIEFHGLPTYVAQPDEGYPEKGIIVFITDIFGWKFVNSRLLADRLAKKGEYAVYIPDFMNGADASSKAPDAMRFAAAYSKPSSLLHTIFVKPFYVLASIFLLAGTAIKTRPSVAKPIVLGFMRKLRADPATTATKIGVIGFCWGGQYVILLAQNDSGPGSAGERPLVDAAFTAHPAQLDIPGDIQKVKVPLSMALSEHDVWVKPAQAQILKKIVKEEPYEVEIFKGTKHGFALREDPEDEAEAAAAEKAQEQALSWFKRFIDL